jgi:hypothetical protein
MVDDKAELNSFDQQTIVTTLWQKAKEYLQKMAKPLYYLQKMQF